ncbi:MAG: hypothetical protein RL338_691 [Chloroflexota bacterium]
MTDQRASAVDALADRYWERALELSPLTATVYGDDRWDDRLPDPGPAGRARARALFEETRRAADAIPEAGLQVEERLTRDALRLLCEISLEELDRRWYLVEAVDQMGGAQTTLPDLSNFQRADTPERLGKLLARIEAYPAYIEATSELLREAIAAGTTQPSIVVERTIAQFERLLALPVAEHPLASRTAVASEGDRATIAAAIERYARPADRAHLELLRSSYLPAARPSVGLTTIPGGDALYRQRIRYWTTLPLEPEAVHAIGLEEIEAIDVERRAIANAAGLGDDVAAYRRAMREDPADRPASVEALIARATEDVGRALEAAPRYFGRLPLAGCEVRAVEAFKEADAPPAYYYPPTVDRSRPGIYYVNTYDLPSRHFSTLASTTYHEATPGHHFQISLEMELPGLPLFRRLGARAVSASFVEGWGLYSERLADEMGLYRDAYERFAMLDAQAWRAARLVVDTGMHALGWTRDRSIRYLADAAGIVETDAIIETDRYIAWPGQALAYMIGRREIDRLRAEAAAALGSRFDLRAFHDAAIGHGSLPLATLARELPRWLGIG